MASISYVSQEICVKIVYYGPGLSGKTTNLQVIYKNVIPDFRSNLVSIATENERTLFFDFLPLDLGNIKGFKIKLQLYTVPGQVYYNATRKLVLRGVDGLVFVADSGPDKLEENISSLNNLEENLILYKYRIENIPMVIQYNKRDIANALSLEEMQYYINRYNFPWKEAVASEGIGVFDTLKLIGKNVIDDINKRYILAYKKRSNLNNTPVQQYQQYQSPQLRGSA
jgi:mutual gliding-motility protein MglA